MDDDYDQGIHIPTFNARRRAEIEAKATELQSLRAALAKSEEARETAERERDEAQSACTAWQGIFEGLEAHLMDRVNMGDEATPETYLYILRGYVANIIRDSKAIANARWADYGRHETALRAAEASLSQALARIEEMEKALEWQPIETAPRDGTRFLAAEPEDGWIIGICVWCKTPHVPIYGFHFTDGDPEDWDMCNPKFWRPLTAPTHPHEGDSA